MPEASDGQVAVFLPGLLLVMTVCCRRPPADHGGARLMARRSTLATTLIAARRLADKQNAAPAISGIMLALFITTWRPA